MGDVLPMIILHTVRRAHVRERADIVPEPMILLRRAFCGRLCGRTAHIHLCALADKPLYQVEPGIAIAPSYKDNFPFKTLHFNFSFIGR